MTQLTDTQLVVLSAASSRDDGSILPLPANLKGGAAANLVDGLIRRGLAERIESDRAAVPDLVRITRAGLAVIGVESEDEAPAEAEAEPEGAGEPDAVVAEAAAAEPEPEAAGEPGVVDAEAAETDTPADAAEQPAAPANGARAPREGTKQALLIEMLRRPEGATIAEVVAETSWQPHTVRGAIAGALKKKLGLAVTSEKIPDRGRVYRIEA